MEPLILRTFRTKADPATLSAYERFEETEGIPMVRSMPGCLAAGFGRVPNASEPTYLFFSVWQEENAMERARATPRWKAVVQKLESMGCTIGEPLVEHVRLSAFSSVAREASIARR